MSKETDAGMAGSGGSHRLATAAPPGRDPAGSSLALPALFELADSSSLAAQRRFLTATRFRLVALVTAAGGEVTITLGTSEADYGGVLAAVAFLAALSAEAYIQRSRPHEGWFDGRAVAEAVKSLAWRYAVRGEPLGSVDGGGADLGDFSEADDLLLERMSEVLSGMRRVEVSPGTIEGAQITASMRALRRAPLPVRRDAYREHRIREQRHWYASRSRSNASAAQRWTLLMVAIEALGGALAILKATGQFSAGELLLGLAGAGAAAVLAWGQTRQYEALARAYAVAATELGWILERIDRPRTDVEWATFVGEAEQTISREHHLWRASRTVGHGP